MKIYLKNSVKRGGCATWQAEISKKNNHYDPFCVEGNYHDEYNGSFQRPVLQANGAAWMVLTIGEIGAINVLWTGVTIGVTTAPWLCTTVDDWCEMEVGTCDTIEPTLAIDGTWYSATDGMVLMSV